MKKSRKDYIRKWREENPEKVKLQRERERVKVKERGYDPIKDYQNCKESKDRAHYKYVEKNKESDRAYHKEYARNHPPTEEQKQRRKELYLTRYKGRYNNKTPEQKLKAHLYYERVKNEPWYIEKVKEYREKAKEKRRLEKEERLRKEREQIISIGLSDAEIEKHKEDIETLIKSFQNS